MCYNYFTFYIGASQNDLEGLGQCEIVCLREKRFLAEQIRMHQKGLELRAPNAPMVSMI